MRLPETIRTLFAAHGRAGGKSKSAAKVAAVRRNLERARAKSAETFRARAMAAKARRNMLPRAHRTTGRDER